MAATGLAAVLLVAALPVAAQVARTDVTISYDDHGVPYIEGETRAAMAYGAGFATATDRLFQTDVLRHLAQGRLSELLGAGPDDANLIADQVMRREFYDPADIQAQYEALPERIKTLLEAYAAGFNDALVLQQANPAERSVAFNALAHEPEPWQPTDSVSILMLFTVVTFAGEGAGGELDNAALLDELLDEHGARGHELFDDLVLLNDPAAPAAVPFGEGPPAPQVLPGPGPLPFTPERRAQIRLARTTPVAETAQRARAERALLQRVWAQVPFPKLGSYAVAVGGTRTRSGGGVLLGSPQAGFFAPSVFYEMALSAPDWRCRGFTVPGLGPFIGIGWCGDHAWTLVAGNAGDQVDVYVERLHPDDPNRYRFRGEWRTMEVRQETYVTRATVPPEPPRVVTQEIRSTVHGPVFASDPEAGVAYVFKRAQTGHFARSYLGLLALNTGDGLDEVERGLRHITATYNLIYADAQGHIAYRFTGYQPVRAKGVDFRLPVPGTGSAEWRARTLDFDAMPHVTDPKSGILHVNQGIDTKPIEWWPRSSSIFVGRIGHTAGDQELMANDTDVTVGALRLRNRDVIAEVDTITARLAPLIERALKRVGPSGPLAKARVLFTGWARAGFPRVDADGDGRYDYAAIALFGADYFEVPVAPVWQLFMEDLWAPAGRVPPTTYIGRLGQTLAAIEDPQLFSRPYARQWEEMFLQALERSLPLLQERFEGAPMESWLVATPEHAFTAIGVVAPPPLRTVDHGTYSQIVDPAAAHGVNVLPPGNGRADRAADVALFQLTGELPDDFVDQIEMYEDYRFKPMRFEPPDDARILRLNYDSPPGP